MYYGPGRQPFTRENKTRPSRRKYSSARSSKTFMTRCIQCTRCVRFMTEIAGVGGTRLPSAAARIWRSPPYLERGYAVGALGATWLICVPVRSADPRSPNSFVRASVGTAEDRIHRCNGRTWFRTFVSIAADGEGCFASCRAIHDGRE